ncbi:hypothetical protein B0I35DRAFT_42626 [Stachybotrys elegans]|uniref:Uncharacterized protein n=1 Tax=Stachybotrys elegans TaxID=80388 RepID=A0A8K0WYX4_9HYPO|nr:hypothetical protein B0I35DRAFT_42626 [Stachybotrys elegans]
MKSSLFAAAISALAISASPIHKRQVGGVLICTGANATGECTHNVYELKTCHDLPAPFFQNASTFAPDGEAFDCFPRVGTCDQICTSPTGCTFGAVDFNYEHKYNLSAIGWGNLMGHFDCSLKR